MGTNNAFFTFSGSVRDFLPKGTTPARMSYSFQEHPSVKDAIEAIGPPHPEVCAIVVNGRPVDFGYQLFEGDVVEVFGCDAIPSGFPEDALLPNHPGERPRFVLDVHLGTLARYLRMSGFDTLYQREDLGDERIAEIAGKERRIALSRDIGLLKRGRVEYGHWLRSTDPRIQFTELVSRYPMKGYLGTQVRCSHCNGRIANVDKEQVLHRLPPSVRDHYDTVYRCESCDQLYWQGSHYVKWQGFLETL
ncbi:MoaD/ThiS family protein [Sulfidibacter corallicola]|uniref:MoaD/ThiS family protein n=1 Tax=Sulfidibacter corallicola TaxID=2818388 RepID=A0A8A4TEA1_SULCO|nr:Mut7-C RNAse domain-containing protein [Sulfidibacter corallicola]QTD47554.1 MoaD/ThiS family protein [Sulfidibacter corallicola]